MISRYDLTEFEWRVIEPLLPNKPRGVPRVDDRRVLNGIFWVLRSGSPWRDLPERYGPHTTRYNRLRRWSRAGVWDRGRWANIPLKSNRKSPVCFSPWLYKQRNLVERLLASPPFGSTNSNTTVASQPHTTNSDQHSSPWSNSPASASDYALMSPRPSQISLKN